MHTPAFSAADYDKKIRQTVPFFTMLTLNRPPLPYGNVSNAPSAGWI